MSRAAGVHTIFDHQGMSQIIDHGRRV